MMPSPASTETSPLLPHHPTADNEEPVYHPEESEAALAFKIAAAMYSFSVLGLFTSSIGALLPSISDHYHLDDLHVSTIFLVGPLGYVVASQSNVFFHARFGQLGVAVAGPLLHILAAVAVALRPHFSVVLVAFGAAAAGCGLLDGSWCAWAAAMGKGNTVAGMLHGSFSVGAAVGPFLVAVMVNKGQREWHEWYYVLAAASTIELAALLLAFRHGKSSTGYGEAHGHTNYWESLQKCFKHQATWASAAYFLAYVGTETAISGWIVSFMERARNGTPYQASLASTVFWAGMAAGRFVLGPVTDRMGVTGATSGYLLCALAIQAVFSMVRTPVGSILLMAVLGFVMGPLFPSGTVLLIKHLPKPLHVQAVSFVAAVGQVGAAIVPFGIGALIQMIGVFAFKYAIVSFLVLTLLLWDAFARVRLGTTGETLGGDVSN